jgi:hypothetical protein
LTGSSRRICTRSVVDIPVGVVGRAPFAEASPTRTMWLFGSAEQGGAALPVFMSTTQFRSLGFPFPDILDRDFNYCADIEVWRYMYPRMRNGNSVQTGKRTARLRKRGCRVFPTPEQLESIRKPFSG